MATATAAMHHPLPLEFQLLKETHSMADLTEREWGRLIVAEAGIMAVGLGRQENLEFEGHFQGYLSRCLD